MSQIEKFFETTQAFKEYSSRNVQEKIFLHTSANLWVAGESAWFKIHLVDSKSHQLSNTSKVVYIELLTADNKIVLDAKIQITKGTGQGHIVIPASFSSGNYYIRAYTRWMKNFPAEFYFHQPITILNTFRKVSEQETPSKNSIEIHFFPEGGYLIDGTLQKVAFQAIDHRGNGINFSGVIVNHHGDTITNIKPVTFGIGAFELIPERSIKYKAIISYQNQNTIVDLPQIQGAGYAIRVLDTLDNQLKVSVILKGKTDHLVHLIGHTRQQIKFANSYMLKDGKLEVTIDKNLLEPGISHFTLFNSDGQPVCERLIFTKPSNNSSLTLKTNKDQTTTRKQILLDIQSTLNSDKSLSVAVNRMDQLNQFSLPTIVSNLLLSSDLKGTIEAPEYYMTASDKEIDNLMLTHGWSRFRWENLNNDQPIIFMPEYRGHLLEANLTDNDGKPVIAEIGYISTPGKKIEFSGSKSDSQGKIFINSNFIGSKKLVLQTTEPQSNIKLLSPFSTQFATVKIPPVFLSEKNSREIIRKSVSMQIADTFGDSDKFKPETDSSAFYGTAPEIYLLDDYTRFPVMEEVMREYVKSVWVRKKGDQFTFKIVNRDKGDLLDGEALILLDGVPIFNVNDIMAFDPLKIKQLDVLPSRYFVGSLAFDGIVSYRTYKGDLGGFKFSPETVIIDYEGLQQQKEFYSPRYETVPEINSRIPDGRHLLYWNPEVKINGSEARQLEFYTSDQPGTYRVVVQGIAADGTPLYGETTFKVVR